MASKTLFTTTFEVADTIQPIFTGGNIALDRNGGILATTLGEDALLTDLESGKHLAKIEGDGEIISTLTLTPSASHLIICSRSLSMRIYSLHPSPCASDPVKFELRRTIKAHVTPVVALAVDQTGTLLATGAADGVIKVWDIAGGYVTHLFRGPNVLISSLHFFELKPKAEERTGISARNRKKEPKHITPNKANPEVSTNFYLASGSQDGKTKIWDLFKRACTSTLNAHVSDVTALDYSSEENALLTASRDKTIMCWDAKTWKVRKVVPVLEEVECAGFLESGKYIYTGGMNGNLRIWQTEDGREVTSPQVAKNETDGIVGSLHWKNYILTVQTGHTLTLYSTSPLENTRFSDLIPSLPVIRRISGTHDEIIDLGYLLPDRSMLALATNSEEIRIVSLGKKSDTGVATNYFGADVAQLKGHDDIIICLDIDWSGHWIATGAKDNTARIWRIDAENSSFTCYRTFTGHAESIGAICLPHQAPPESSSASKAPLEHPPRFMLTGSQDQTVKRWDISSSKDSASNRKAPRAVYTRKAHDKDINAIDINHNSQLFASASQDRTVKIWDVDEGEVLGVLRGHKRGVWSVKFAPKEIPAIAGQSGLATKNGIILTGSGDKTIKIWNLSDYTCLRTFEGHSNSVLKVCWLNLPSTGGRQRSSQIVSAGGDGLVKVWDANTGEVACTLDNHEDRVWALAVNPATNMIVSGSGDSTVTFWEDTTSSTQAASIAAATQFVEQEQELQNYIHSKSYREAITLALQLNHPGRLLALFKAVVTAQPEPGSLCGLKAVDAVVASLSDDQLYSLLLRLRDWNTNARTAPVAQKVLWTIVKSYPSSKLATLKVRERNGDKSIKEVFNALKVYSEKHYKKMDELFDASYLVEYTLKGIDGLDSPQGGYATKESRLDTEGDMIMV
ncbi:putative U3 small nucleolar RNA-associated protein 13 [Podosphaera aphanis]|nr:putative U3 small nucleolar RNA-associated protein 13 [Podosphaera aphanis]